MEACFGISAPNSLVGLDPSHTVHRSPRPDTETPIPKDRPLRVLHLCAGNLYGGIETMLMTMVRNRRLCPAMESEFLLCFSGRFEDELRAAGGRVHRVPEVRIRHPWTLLKARWELQRILETERFDVALSKEIEGQIRSKFSTVPIPNGDVTLNGAQLISDARAEMDALRQQLKEMLEETTYQKLMEREAQMAGYLKDTWQNAPLGIYIG